MIAYFHTINYTGLYGGGVRGEILEHYICTESENIPNLNSSGYYYWTNPVDGTDIIYIDLNIIIDETIFHDSIRTKIREYKLDYIIDGE